MVRNGALDKQRPTFFLLDAEDVAFDLVFFALAMQRRDQANAPLNEMESALTDLAIGLGLAWSDAEMVRYQTRWVPEF